MSNMYRSTLKSSGGGSFIFDRYVVGNSSAIVINNISPGDYFIMVGYSWTSSYKASLRTLQKTGLSEEINFGDLAPLEGLIGGATTDNISQYEASSGFIIYKATASTVSIAQSGSQYMILVYHN